LGPQEQSGYRAYVEGRVLELGIEQGRKQWEQEWKALRRGWYFGGAKFRERMLELINEPLSRGRRGSYSGEAKREHGEAEADRLVRLGLPLVGLGESDLAVLPKRGIEKQVLAWWLCQHTTVGRRWVSERLNMGDESRVTQALRRTKAVAEPAVEALKERLESAYAVGVTRA
jgi:hypothetical protein